MPANALDAAISHTPLARSLHAITGFNDGEQRSLDFPLSGFTGRSPIEDSSKMRRAFSNSRRAFCRAFGASGSCRVILTSHNDCRGTKTP